MSTLTSKSTKPLLHPPNTSIPILGFGTCQSQTCTQSALTALRNGYIHLDTAQIYRNEAETGQAIAQSAIPQDSLFICSKLWEDKYTRTDALESVITSNAKLGLECIDLYLLHVPRPGPQARRDAWLGLQDAQRKGLVKTIGVSNWAPRHIEELMNSNHENDKDEDKITVFPAVNQLEFHPWQQQREIKPYCDANGIVVVAYSPLAQATRLSDPVIVDIAQRHRRTPAQVVLRWCLQKGVVVIPKSDRDDRIRENADVFGFELDEAEMQRVDGLDRGQDGNVGEWDPFAWE